MCIRDSPLVVYSHGSGGQRWIHANYTEFLASHGYVVIAPDHTGNTLIERFTGVEIDRDAVLIQRAADITALLDATFDAGALDSLASSLNGDVVVTGHSFGGLTAYATVSGITTGAGTYEADPRVTAIITLAPAAGPTLLPDEQLSSITVPHLVIGATSDDTTPIDPNVERPWELLGSEVSYRVDLVAAEHETFTDLCSYPAELRELESVPELVVDAVGDFSATSCAPTAMPLERAREIVNSFAVRFLDEVTGDGPALSSGDVAFGEDLVFVAR